MTHSLVHVAKWVFCWLLNFQTFGEIKSKFLKGSRISSKYWSFEKLRVQKIRGKIILQCLAEENQKKQFLV